MTRRTVLIVPAAVPRAQVTRRVPEQPTTTPVETVAAAAVPAPAVLPVHPEQLTAAEVAQLREENRLLREELARVQQRS